MLAAFPLDVFHQRAPSVPEPAIVMTFTAPSSGHFLQMLLCLTMIPGTLPNSKRTMKAGSIFPSVSQRRNITKKTCPDARIGSRIIPVPLILEMSEIGKHTW